MKKSLYVSPRIEQRMLRLQCNVMSEGSTDNVHDNGLPGLESDGSTLNWFDSLEW
jgi:hypothetical protein